MVMLCELIMSASILLCAQWYQERVAQAFVDTPKQTKLPGLSVAQERASASGITILRSCIGTSVPTKHFMSFQGFGPECFQEDVGIQSIWMSITMDKQ